VLTEEEVVHRNVQTENSQGVSSSRGQSFRIPLYRQSLTARKEKEGAGGTVREQAREYPRIALASFQGEGVDVSASGESRESGLSRTWEG